jgi:glycosyltransferase involved in cell wall biosynthesis
MTASANKAQPIRILRIIARLNVGGPAIHVTLLTEKLAAPDYETTLACGTIEPGEGDMAYFAEAHGVQPLFIPELGRSLNPLRDLTTIWKVYCLIRQLKPDVVHTHTAKAGFVGRVAAWLARVPVIVHTFHGHVFQGYFSWPKTRFFIFLERLTARMSDTIITLTDGLRRELAEDYHIARKGHITVLPLGLDLEPFANTPRKNGTFRAAWNIPADVPLIGIVGRLVPVKNHALFLEAAAQIKASLPAAHFSIIGDGETRATIEAQAQALGLHNSLTITGWQRDLAPIYSDLDALVISSLNEGTPVSVIEALSGACPVVTTAVGGLPDLLDHGALGKLTPPGDASALATAILDTLLNPPDAAEAQRLMLDRYGINRLVRDLDSLYRGLLAKKRPQN